MSTSSPVDIAVPARNEERDLAAGARRLAWQLPRFIAIGVASTVAYLLLYLLLRLVMPAQAANALSLLLTAIGNTAANRRLTFGVRGRAGAARQQVQGLIAFAAGLLLTSGALAALHAVTSPPGKGAEVTVLVAANLAATLLRFVLYRAWVFRAPAAPADSGSYLKAPGRAGRATGGAR